jgi:CubicO group peptidase (beta-lactamase class C family)
VIFLNAALKVAFELKPEARPQLHARAGNAQGARITMRQLLNRTGGLADMFFDDATAGDRRFLLPIVTSSTCLAC